MSKILSFIEDMWKADYQFKTFFFSAMSVFIGFGFTIFNAVLGIVYKSVWNGTISVYYVFLAIVRGIIVLSQRKYDEDDYGSKRKVYIITHILMIFMDLCLIAPIAFMVMGDRTYKYGLIPAITMAAYTTYRVVMGSLQLSSSRKYENILVKELKVINLQDSLVAVLSLQNSLIIATGTSVSSMVKLTGWTSGGIWLLIVLFTVKSLFYIKKADFNKT